MILLSTSASPLTSLTLACDWSAGGQLTPALVSYWWRLCADCADPVHLITSREKLRAELMKKIIKILEPNLSE